MPPRLGSVGNDSVGLFGYATPRFAPSLSGVFLGSDVVRVIGEVLSLECFATTTRNNNVLSFFFLRGT